MMENQAEKANSLAKEILTELKPLTLDLSNKNVTFVNTLGISSATIASFSLLALQSSSFLQVNKTFLLLGFAVLVINVFISLLIVRIWIDCEENTVKRNVVKLLDLTLEGASILRNDSKVGKETNAGKMTKIYQELENLAQSDDEQKIKNERIQRWLGISIYAALIIFFIGIGLIILSILPNFLGKNTKQYENNHHYYLKSREIIPKKI